MPLKPRKKYLIQPRIQLLYSLVFLSTGGIYVLLQAILLNWNVFRLAGSMPPGAEHVIDELATSMRLNLLATFALLVPLTLSMGILITHRVAGPLYRFEMFLKDIIAGKQPPDCRLRKNDELKELCRLMNDATRPLRDPAPAAAHHVDVDAVPAPTPFPERVQEGTSSR